MDNLQFDSFIATPGEKHTGIASIIYQGIIIRYKIQLSDKGFLMVFPFATKVKDPITQEEKWLSAVEIDSRSEHKRIEEFIRHHSKIAMNQTSARPDLVQNVTRPMGAMYAPPSNDSNNLPF